MPSYSGIWTLQQQMQAKAQSLWPAVPGAPTIGTATSPSSTTASVAFTAPANLGVPPLTSYTATSSPGGFTGTGASSPITVSGLTAGTTYTFTVTATNALGTGPASAASNSVTPLPAIGAAYGGGYFAGQISTAGNGIADYNLVIAPRSSGQSVNKWKFPVPPPSTTPGADSNINGPQNTLDMVADGNSSAYPAAYFCNDLVVGGYSDWYMPAKNELEVCYYNLKPTTTSNSTSSGTNTNAVPSRGSSYTAGTPARTSAAAFQTGGAEAFTTTNQSPAVSPQYWVSTESNPYTASTQDFNQGLQSFNYKSFNYVFRATRRVAV